MPKKKFIHLVLILCIIPIMFAGCSQSINSDAKDSKEALEGNLTINGGSVGGIWSVFTEGVAEAIRREYPGTLISAVPGTVSGNPTIVNNGKAEFAISESLTAQFAYEGTGPFSEKNDDIRAVAAIMPENVFQFVAPEKANFDSVRDIVNDKTAMSYSAGEKDALGDVVSAAVFESYGVTYDTIEENGGDVQFLPGSKTFELMRDGRIDGLGKMVPIPAGDIIEASASIDLKLIPIGDEAIEQLIEDYGMTRYTMDAGSYDFQKEDYETVNSPTILITNADMSDEDVYKVTEAIYNQLDYLHGVNNGFKKVNDETIVEVGSIPMHDGAKAFYEENGLLP
ncbi:MAG TPA: TAXI family TRAP transporter solute-binding subunit [Bacillota bacterium]|nr:TAXI family TRAP transporter solute-binding subunit [Bacillota bacterium]